MCGFIGFTGQIEAREEILSKMMKRIAHRGPDMSGSYVDDRIALGFVRLSIIDLSPEGSQPMFNEDGSLVIVFNGEIYNFMELRERLAAAGHTFRTKGDTEVLLHGYEEYGENLVDHLRGMYAFVIWDKNRRRLYGARDLFGIKPFYYCKLGSGWMFGSEIKSFLDHPDFVKEVNRDALRPYLTFQYPVTEETFFRGVFRLPPAHCFTLEEGGEMQIRRYWDAAFKDDRDLADRDVSFEECRDRLDAAVRESVAAHKISDVKVGAFLSGGVDSSYITALLMPDKTFSVGFDYKNFNETNEAGELSERLGIENYRHMVTADECFDTFPEIQYHMDEPQSNPSCVPLYFLAKLAAEQVTVVLSGEGADEIFAGYEWYDDTPAVRRFKKLPAGLRRALGRMVRPLPSFKGKAFLMRSSGEPEQYFIGQAKVFSERDAKKILVPECRNGPSPDELTSAVYRRVAGRDELVKKQYLDMNLWLPGDILLKADKMSMAHSLELRVPYLDRKIMEMAAEIPSRYKINGIDTKYVMREAANMSLPDEWAHRKKLGFPVPIRYWLREEKYRERVASYFNADFAAEFFDRAQLNRLLNDHASGKRDCQRQIWTVFTFLVWYKRFFIDFV